MVKSKAMFKLISQPPKTYSRKLTFLIVSNFSTLISYFLLVTMGDLFLRSCKVVKDVPNSLLSPFFNCLKKSNLIFALSSLLQRRVRSIFNSSQCSWFPCLFLNSDLKTGLNLLGLSSFQMMKKISPLSASLPLIYNLALSDAPYCTSSATILIWPLLDLAGFFIS